MARLKSASMILLVLVFAAACDFQKSGPSGPNVPGHGAQVGDIPTDFTLLDQHGMPVSLSDFRGNVILLDISTMWCHYCQIEAEHGEEMYQQYRNQGFVMLNVLYADYNGAPMSVDKCHDWAEFYEITFPILADADESVYKIYNETNEIPLNIIIDRDFRIRHKEPGYNDTTVRQLIESLL